MTDYGRGAIEKIVPQLVGQGITVVSGFMYGVDQYAHQTTLECGGKTIAVLGWGIDGKLSGQDKEMADQIIKCGGLILSEWQSQVPTLWTFPKRNRIVAALCQEVIIVEAAEKSGSLITAKIAGELGRKVFSVPGPITSRASQGTNTLIAKGEAAVWQGQFEKSKRTDSDPLLAALEDQPQSANELSRKLDISISELGAKLSLLSLSGQVKERNGKYCLADAG